MENIFRYQLYKEEPNTPIERIELPILLNIGEQFEVPDVGTYEVRELEKTNGYYVIRCMRINETPWVYDHLKAEEHRILSKSKGVSA